MKLSKNSAVLASLIVPATVRPRLPTSKEVEAVYPEAHALYLDLHQNPELSSHETQTAAKLASRLRGLGYEVTEHVGGTGIVAIYEKWRRTDGHAAHRTRCAAGRGEDRAFLREQSSQLKTTPGTMFR